eukprot:5752615-Alexandrium_andersonii.AAC.1
MRCQRRELRLCSGGVPVLGCWGPRSGFTVSREVQGWGGGGLETLLAGASPVVRRACPVRQLGVPLRARPPSLAQ